MLSLLLGRFSAPSVKLYLKTILKTFHEMMVRHPYLLLALRSPKMVHATGTRWQTLDYPGWGIGVYKLQDHCVSNICVEVQDHCVSNIRDEVIYKIYK